MGVRQFAACNRIRISYKITYLGTRNLVSVSDNQRGAARAVNTQSALGVVAFVASVILHHASRHLTCASVRHRSLSR